MGYKSSGDKAFFDFYKWTRKVSAKKKRIKEFKAKGGFAPLTKEQEALLNGELPPAIGGGIGQSRLCMLLLGRAHVGEVQASVWPEEMRAACEDHNIMLL